MKTINDLKVNLKELAGKIHTAKQERKTVHFKGKRTIKSKYSFFSDDQYAAHVVIPELSSEFRVKHIAYCMLRGKTYEEIEPKVKDENVLSSSAWNTIEEIKEEYGHYEEEDVRLSA